MDRAGARALWARAQRGWPQGFPLVQFPNAPLLVAMGGWLVAKVTGGTVHDIANGVFTAGLVVWALLELLQGSNWVRRLLGAVVLAFQIAALA